MKICEIIREEYISSRVPAAGGYLTDDEIRVLRENPKILQEWIGPAATLIAKYGKKAYDAAKKFFKKKKEHKSGRIIDKNFDREQRLSDYGDTGSDIIEDEIRVLRENPKILQEVIPLIPLGIMGVGAAWTAYEAWQMKQAYDRGEISGADVAKAVGTEAAIMIIGGAVAKVGVKAWKYGKKIFDSKKAAQKAAMTDAAATVNARAAKEQSKDLVVQPVQPKPLEGDILPPVTVPKPPARGTAVGPKPKSGEQEIAPPGGVFYSDVEKGFDKLMGPGRGPRAKPTKEQLKQMKKRDDAEIAADIDAGGPALRAAEKARKIAKYKETENVEDLRGLSFSDAFQLGGIDLAKKFPLPKPTIPAHLRTAAGREHAALSNREHIAKLMKAIKNDKP